MAEVIIKVDEFRRSVDLDTNQINRICYNARHIRLSRCIQCPTDCGSPTNLTFRSYQINRGVVEITYDWGMRQ